MFCITSNYVWVSNMIICLRSSIFFIEQSSSRNNAIGRCINILSLLFLKDQCFPFSPFSLSLSLPSSSLSVQLFFPRVVWIACYSRFVPRLSVEPARVWSFFPSISVSDVENRRLFRGSHCILFRWIVSGIRFKVTIDGLIRWYIILIPRSIK